MHFVAALDRQRLHAGVRGLFTGYLPTLLEDVPDMAFKFAAYESMRSLHTRLRRGRKPSPQVLLMPQALTLKHWSIQHNQACCKATTCGNGRLS